MPPKPMKKKGPVEEPINYDLTQMNRLELKEYAKILESDIEYLRNYSNFYQKTGDELGDYYSSRVDELARMEVAIVDKDHAMEAIREKVAKDLLEKSDFEGYDEFFNDRRDEQQEQEISDRLQKALEEHLEEENRLKEIIDEKEREMAAETTKLEMIRRDALERSAKRMEDTDEKDRIMFEKSMIAYANMLKDTKTLNKMELDTFKDETMEAKRKSEIQYQDRCRTYKERLQKYYQDITREDLDNIKELMQKVKKLEDKIRDFQSKLKMMRQQNQELKRNQGSTRPPSKYVPQDKSTHRKIMKARRARNLKRIEEVEAANTEVQRQIHVVLEQSDTLRKDFSRALSEVRRNAETRTHLLMERLEISADGDRNLEKVRDAVRLLDEMPDLERDDEGGEKVLTLEEMLALVRQDGDGKILTLDEMQDLVGQAGEGEVLTLDEMKDLVKQDEDDECASILDEILDLAVLEGDEKMSTLDEMEDLVRQEGDENMSTLDQMKDLVGQDGDENLSALDEIPESEEQESDGNTAALDQMKDLVGQDGDENTSILDEELGGDEHLGNDEDSTVD